MTEGMQGKTAETIEEMTRNHTVGGKKSQSVQVVGGRMRGCQSIEFEKLPLILEYASVAGSKESRGPLKDEFDECCTDDLFGSDTWEKAESAMQKRTVDLLLKKARLNESDIRYLFAGDLLGQLIASTFGLRDFEIPFFGLYGACSTMGEALSLGSVMISAVYAKHVITLASSHFASAEKTFRFPLEYGNQRPYSATWTVTGCGALILGDEETTDLKAKARIRGITTGKIVDFGVKDSMNMGACMAPAAADVIRANLADFGYDVDEYDKIITGDLGYTGQTILLDLLNAIDIDIERQHLDCGIEMFDSEKQDTHSGGSGCGCSATTLCGHIMKKIESGEWKKVLFVPTGALLSPISFNEGQSVPGIAHAVVIEGV